MNYRAKNIGIAVALAALAAILTSVYVVNYKRHVQHGEGKVTVLVAARDIPAGTSGADVIDQKMLGKRLPDLRGPIYYSAGPPAMVAAMREMLLKAGVDEDDVRAEDFAGY